MSKLQTFLKILAQVGPTVLMFTPLAPIAQAVTLAIGEAEQIPGATGQQKLGHVVAIAVSAAQAANVEAGRQVVDPLLVVKTAQDAVSTTVDAVNLVHGARSVQAVVNATPPAA